MWGAVKHPANRYDMFLRGKALAQPGFSNSTTQLPRPRGVDAPPGIPGMRTSLKGFQLGSYGKKQMPANERRAIFAKLGKGGY